ncbi:MAG TPA: ion channel [Gammaproteobacteria bacterium]
MNTNWFTRIASTQFLVLYPIQSAGIFHTQSGWEAYVSASFIVVGACLLNYIFLKDLFAIFRSTKPLNDLYKEYTWVVAIAFLNISMFASFYHMFGITHNSEIVLNDWYNSFYFSVVTWTTLGYGDFAPVENLRLVSAFQAMMGYFYMAILVGLLLNLSQHTMKPKVASKSMQPTTEAAID